MKGRWEGSYLQVLQYQQPDHVLITKGNDTLLQRNIANNILTKLLLKPLPIMGQNDILS